MELGISIHLDFYQLREQTIKLKVSQLYSRCIIVSSNTLLKMTIMKLDSSIILRNNFFRYSNA